MQFRVSNNTVYLASTEDTLELGREQFLELESDAVLPPVDTVEFWTPELHYIQNPDQRDGSEYGDRSIYIAKIAEYRASLAAQVVPPTIAQLKQSLIDQVKIYAESLLKNLVEVYPASEPLTWSYKLQEAEAYLATDNPDVAPNLEVEALTRGISLQLLAQTIVAKSQQYRGRVAQISGVRGRHTDTIAHLQSISELENYNWRSGWE